MSTTAKVEVSLEPGQYLLDLHPAHPPRAWKHQGEGVFSGHGGKIRRIAIADALRELIIAAERHEGIQS